MQTDCSGSDSGAGFTIKVVPMPVRNDDASVLSGQVRIIHGSISYL